MPKHNYDETLNNLVDRANEVATTGTEQQKAQFKVELQKLASASNKNADERQAAMQLRLPDVMVGRNEEGNLSFSRANTINPQLPREFAATAEVVKPGDTIIVGDQTGVGRLTARPRDTQMAVTGNQLAQIGDSATSPAIKGITAQLTAIDAMADPQAKQRAFINLSESIELAKSSRQIELINMKERELGVPELESRLRQEEAADRADEKWQQNQVDSPITAEVRQRLRTAKADAYTYGQREIAVDPVLTSLDGKLKQVGGIIQMEVTGESAKDKNRKDVWDSYGPEAQATVKAAIAAETGKSVTQITDKEAPDFLVNPRVASALQMDAPMLLASAVQTGTPDAKFYANTLRNMPNIDNPDMLIKTMQDVQSAVNVARAGEDGLAKASPEIRILARDPDIIAMAQQGGILAELQGGTTQGERASKAQQEQYKMAQLAITKYMDTLVAEKVRTYTELPEPQVPALVPVVAEAREAGTGLRGIINTQAVQGLLDPNNPQGSQANIEALVQYIVPLYRAQLPRMQLGVDPAIGIERELRMALQAKLTGLANRESILGGYNRLFQSGSERGAQGRTLSFANDYADSIRNNQ